MLCELFQKLFMTEKRVRWSRRLEIRTKPEVALRSARHELSEYRKRKRPSVTTFSSSTVHELANTGKLTCFYDQMTVIQVFRQLGRSPDELLLRRWNWKSAIFSSLVRAPIFFFCNLGAGRSAATSAMLAEFAYRGITAGFYGALTQAFRKAQPLWAANLAVVVLLPLTSHSIEFCVHFLRGTPKLLTSLASSVFFTMISTLFNIYAMRRGALVVGEDSNSVASDLRRVPRLIAGFVACGPVALYRWMLIRNTQSEPEAKAP